MLRDVGEEEGQTEDIQIQNNIRLKELQRSVELSKTFETRNQASNALPDLINSRPLHIDVGLREVTLKPGVTLEISLQEDLVMTVRVKPDSNGQINVDQTPSLQSDETINSKTDLNTNLNQLTRSHFEEESKSTSTNDQILKSTNQSIYNTKENDSALIITKESNTDEADEDNIYNSNLIGVNDNLDLNQDGSSIDDDDINEWSIQNVENINMIKNSDEEDDEDEEDDWNSDVFEDCLEYEESVTDFGCDNNYYAINSRDNSHHLHTIIEEDEEDYEEDESTEEEEDDEEDNQNMLINSETVVENDDNIINTLLNDIKNDSSTDSNDKSPDRFNYRSDNSLDLDSDTEKSELEQFEILEQLCSSSSDDFDAEEFYKVSSYNCEQSPSNQYGDTKSVVDQTGIQSIPNQSDRISSFKEYLKRKDSIKSNNGKGEYINKLTLVQENDGRAKVKPIETTNCDKNTHNSESNILKLTNINSDKNNKINIYNQDLVRGYDESNRLHLNYDNELGIKAINDDKNVEIDCLNEIESSIIDCKVNDNDVKAINKFDEKFQSDLNDISSMKGILKSKISKETNNIDKFKRQFRDDDDIELKSSKGYFIDDCKTDEKDDGFLKGILKTDNLKRDDCLNSSVDDKCNKVGVLKSILKSKTFDDSFSSIDFDDTVEMNGSMSSNMADVSSSSVGFSDSSSTTVGFGDEGDLVESRLNRLLDSSELIELFNDGGQPSRSVRFDEENSSLGDESFEWHEIDGGKSEGVSKGSAGKLDWRSGEAGKRMGRPGAIDSGQLQVTIFDSADGGRSLYDFSSDPWFRNFDGPRLDPVSIGSVTKFARSDEPSETEGNRRRTATFRTQSERGNSSANRIVSSLNALADLMRNKRDNKSLSSTSANSNNSSSETTSSSDANNPSILKSALKKPGKKRKKHKVQFDESLNKFFEADYVILIRDECECGGELCCSNYLQDDDDEDSFADLDDEEQQTSSIVEIPEPPIEFVDQLTLSPPDGYKDTLSDTLNTFQQQYDNVIGNEEVKSCEDNTTQTTPTSPTHQQSLDTLTQGDEDRPEEDFNNSVSGSAGNGGTTGAGSSSSGDRYIVETITMTTVTERRIVRETLDTSHLTPSREELSLRLVRPCTTTKPGSAVRALFPSAVRSPDSEEDTDPLESSLIKRTIERNTLRRSLLKYPGDLRLRRKKQQVPCEESLEEKIRKLTCDIDQEPDQEQRTSPQGQEEHQASLPPPSYSVSRRLCEVLRKEQHPVALEQQYPTYYESASFLASAASAGRIPSCSEHHRPMSAVDLRPPGDLRLLESRPLSAEPPGTRDSVATDYSLGDIDEVLSDCGRQIPPGVDISPRQIRTNILAGTPDPPDELALFVEQDASRIERIRKRYSNSEEESDDYGFSRRPSVRGIKPTFGSTTEILQRMQSQVGPGWPYYPQAGSLNGCRPAPLPGPGVRPICSVQPGAICQQANVVTAYPQHLPPGYPTGYLPYASNGYPPRLYGRQDMPALVRATQTPPHYYPRYRVGSPTKGKLEGRIGPEGAASSSQELQTREDTSLHDIQAALRDVHVSTPPNLHDTSSIDSSLMYAMNV